MEIIQERLEREFNLDLITTAPGVRYKITKTDGEVVEIDNPSRWLNPSEIAQGGRAGHPGAPSCPGKNTLAAFWPWWKKSGASRRRSST